MDILYEKVVKDEMVVLLLTQRGTLVKKDEMQCIQELKLI
jgi:hypothetical protein